MNYIQDVIQDGAQVTQVRKITELENQTREIQSRRPLALWNPMLPPGTINSNDDEFNDQSLSTAWTEFDPNARLTAAEYKYGLVLTKSGAGGAAHELAGLYRALPSGAFTITVRLTHLSYQTGVPTGYSGICLWEDATGAGNKLFEFNWYRNQTTDGLNANEWTNYNTFSSTKLGALTPVWRADSMYLRMRRTGTNYYLDYSILGNGWMSPNDNAAITLGFTPTHMGIFNNFYNSVGGTHKVLFHVFRYQGADVGIDGVLEGDRV